MEPNLTSGEHHFVKPNNSNQCTILLSMNPGGTQMAYQAFTKTNDYAYFG